jgi:hypothetical protein
MIRISVRIDEKLDSQINKYSEEHGIYNKQQAYRKLLAIGLSQETKFDKVKTINFEREMLKEIKLLRNLLVTSSNISKEDVEKKQTYLDNEILKLNLIKEL